VQLSVMLCESLNLLVAPRRETAAEGPDWITQRHVGNCAGHLRQRERLFVGAEAEMTSQSAARMEGHQTWRLDAPILP
jgi:hypothetical protein